MRRDKMKVPRAFTPLTGFTREGEPRAFKRPEGGVAQKVRSTQPRMQTPEPGAGAGE